MTIEDALCWAEKHWCNTQFAIVNDTIRWKCEDGYWHMFLQLNGETNYCMDLCERIELLQQLAKPLEDD